MWNINLTHRSHRRGSYRVRSGAIPQLSNSDSSRILIRKHHFWGRNNGCFVAWLYSAHVPWIWKLTSAARLPLSARRCIEMITLAARAEESTKPDWRDDVGTIVLNGNRKSTCEQTFHSVVNAKVNHSKNLNTEVPSFHACPFAVADNARWTFLFR